MRGRRRWRGSWSSLASRIANARRRAAYGRAVEQFLGWYEARDLRLRDISPLHLAAYIQTHPGSVPTVKQRLAAIRMLGDWLVVSQVLPVNPAEAVRGPKHELLEHIVTGTPAGLRDRALLSVMFLQLCAGERGPEIREEPQGVDGLRWVTTLRAPTIRKLVTAGTVTPSLFDERDLAEVSSEEFPGERLIVCRNPLLAAERRRKRQELLAATEKDLALIQAATRRKNRPLWNAAAIGIRVGKVINRYKVAKHFATTITDEAFTFRRDENKIAAEEQLDGLHIVQSNVEPEQLDAAQTVRAYKDLSKMERAFRCFKSVDLKVRPLHHRRADRVRAHVLLCMLAYYAEWHMRKALAPLLFDDHDPAAAERQRPSVVAPARRSPAASTKAGRKRTKDGLPVHGFRTLLADLGTLTANTMQVAEGWCHLQPADPAHAGAAALLRAPGVNAANVATNAHPLKPATTTIAVSHARSVLKLPSNRSQKTRKC